MIAVESQVRTLKQAAVHANLLLDSLDCERVASAYFRSDLPSSLQRYIHTLLQLEFSALVTLINCKVEFLHKKSLLINSTTN